MCSSDDTLGYLETTSALLMVVTMQVKNNVGVMDDNLCCVSRGKKHIIRYTGRPQRPRMKDDVTMLAKGKAVRLIGMS